jgi:hypothetical protein
MGGSNGSGLRPAINSAIPIDSYQDKKARDDVADFFAI